MEMTTLKKKLGTYVSDAGRLKNVPEDLIYEMLCNWEEWSSTGEEFYRTLGFTHRQIAPLIGKAKKLKREGHFGSADFKEVHVEGYREVASPDGTYLSSPMIEINHGSGNIIRFPAVSHLLEYLKAAS